MNETNRLLIKPQVERLKDFIGFLNKISYLHFKIYVAKITDFEKTTKLKHASNGPNTMHRLFRDFTKNFNLIY